MARRSVKTAENSEDLHVLFANNPLPMWVYDLETLQFLEVNLAAVTQYGYSREEFLAMRITDVRPPEDIPRLLQDLAQQRPRLQDSGEWRHCRKDGQIIDVQIVSHMLEFNGRWAALVVAQDISRHKRAEEQVQRQLKRLSALHAVDLAITSSLDLRVILNVLLAQATAHLHVDAADVLLFHSDSWLLQFGAGHGFRGNRVAGTRLRVGEGYAGEAIVTRRAVRIPNLREAPDIPARHSLLADEEFFAYHAAPLIAKGQVKGVLELFHRGPLDPDQEWLDFLDILVDQAAIAIDNAALFDDLQRSNVKLSLAYDTTLEGWSRAVDLRDHRTEGHSQRATEMALRVARALSMPEADLIHLRRGALLHDIGKMAVPDSILLKPGPLSAEEWEIMRRHPAYAHELLSRIPYLSQALDIPYCHHEKWDGSGYPQGLHGAQIPLAARIFAVANVWDALRSDRPYRPAWAVAQAVTYIREQAGAHFDPQIVAVFMELTTEER